MSCRERFIFVTLVWMTLAPPFFLGSAEVSAQEKKGGVIRLEVTTIEGRVQKPNAFFINTRRSLVYESIEVKDSFLEEVTRVVDSGEF
ncbi:MAG: hypothetical protein JXR76_25490 [Deltaproteobacteria bacterium]|nr:hypothetical protein [Deltaproteobacteria bacterium]